jgi:hypothetical protein
MEAIGGFVSDLLGLEDSRFQYVIDSMTEEEWAVARTVAARREKEDAMEEALERAKQIQASAEGAEQGQPSKELTDETTTEGDEYNQSKRGGDSSVHTGRHYGTPKASPASPSVAQQNSNNSSDSGEDNLELKDVNIIQM